MRYYFWLMFFFAPYAFSQQNFTNDDLKTIKTNIVSGKADLFDVRERQEWDSGHINGAISEPLSTLMPLINSKKIPDLLQKDRILYLYCASGGRASHLAEMLKPLGFDARPLKQGYGELKQVGFGEKSDLLLQCLDKTSPPCKAMKNEKGK